MPCGLVAFFFATWQLPSSGRGMLDAWVVDRPLSEYIVIGSTAEPISLTRGHEHPHSMLSPERLGQQPIPTDPPEAMYTDTACLAGHSI